MILEIDNLDIDLEDGEIPSGIVERILDASGLEIPPGRQDWAVLELQTLIRRQIASSSKERVTREELGRLKEAVTSYTILSRSLVNRFHAPPTPPPDWLKDVDRWIADMERHFSSGETRPTNYWQHRFDREMLGLFAAIYDQPPTSTTSGDASSDGPAARFMLALLAETRGLLMKAKFPDEIVRYRVLANWTVPSPASLKGRISSVLRQARKSGGQKTASSKASTYKTY